MTVVKVCGLRSLDDAQAALAAGANLLGFIFWKPGKRFIAPLLAGQIITTLRRTSRAEFATVGVFVDPSLDEVHAATSLSGVDYVQLSGDESRAVVGAMPRPTIKAVHVRLGEEAAAARLVESDALGARHYLLDTHADGLPGGTGVTFDWAALASIGPRCLIAGGLRADNVASALSILTPFGVDVSSGVESATGVKDPTLIRAFLEAVRTHDQHHHA
jgi:phosphoribosylanthranilate isomerase